MTKTAFWPLSCINIVHSTFRLSAFNDIYSIYQTRCTRCQITGFSDKSSQSRKCVFINYRQKIDEVSALFIGTKRALAVLFCPFFVIEMRERGENVMGRVHIKHFLLYTCSRKWTNQKSLGNLLMGFR
jgi:hypothetical protein